MEKSTASLSHELEAGQNPATGFLKLPLGSILNKIVLPYLLLTLLTAVFGTFIVTRVVAANVQDRLTNQLIETGRAAGDSIVLAEQQQLDALRLAVFSIGVPEALEAGDADTLNLALSALASNQNLYTLLAINDEGTVVAGVRKDDDSYATGWLVGQDLTIAPVIESVINQESDDSGDKYAGILVIEDEIIMLTAAPVYDQTGALLGAMAAGMPLDSLLASVKQEILADVTYYQSPGAPLESTFIIFADTGVINTAAEDGAGIQDDITISQELYNGVLSDPSENILLEEITVNQRSYQTAYIPFRIRDQTLGVVAVSLPTTVVSTLITTNRNGLSVVFAVISGLTVLIGYLIARGLTNPIQRLAKSAEEIRAGNLQARSGVRTADEIGLLGRTFDAMTEQLNEQNRALEEAYMEQEKEAAFLSAILTSAADGIVVIAPNGEIVRVNTVAMDLIQAEEELWLDALSQLFNSASRDESARMRINMENQWYEALASDVIAGKDDEKVGIVVALRDVTDQVLTEHMRTAFIMQISHELRTPLTAAKGFNDLALMVLPETEAKIREFLGRAAEQLDVLITIINQILDVTQLVRQQLELNAEEYDFLQIVYDLLVKHRDELDSRRIGLQVNVDDLPVCYGDSKRLKWALDQVLENALNYMTDDQDNVLTIDIQQSEESIIMEIQDTGVGISRRDLPRIFEQFYRGFPTTPDGSLLDTRGAGLGLFILKSVIDAHQGQVEVVSEVGVGSTFTIELPHNPQI